eukprot:CAMPEP_0194488934 /NCGR_PEP_ID=MMETSP0253-20130528/8672_1 /TAXON_ID=2966 /ORGANISM="Noctiluca scintillans" /LENGTH=128 /DNA_ID=CAMNT_0039329351 /DNA_START=319 /DNA_END=702 /DNA_ORIENTATION=+
MAHHHHHMDQRSDHRMDRLTDRLTDQVTDKGTDQTTDQATVLRRLVLQVIRATAHQVLNRFKELAVGRVSCEVVVLFFDGTGVASSRDTIRLLLCSRELEGFRYGHTCMCSSHDLQPASVGFDVAHES